MRAAEKALDLHITIAGTEPEIWRDVRVPAAITLTDLHKVIQRAFGWDNRHLHMFRSTDAAGQVKARAESFRTSFDGRRMNEYRGLPIFAAPGLEVKNVQELIALAKSQPCAMSPTL